MYHEHYTTSGIYANGSIPYGRDAYISMFISSPFTVAKKWNQHRYPLTVEWIMKIRYIYTVEFYLAINNNEFNRCYKHTWEKTILLINVTE